MLQVSARLFELLLVTNGRVHPGFILTHVVLVLEVQVFIAADDVLVKEFSKLSMAVQVFSCYFFLPRVEHSSSRPNT